MEKQLVALYKKYFEVPSALNAFGGVCSAPLLIGSKTLKAWEASSKRVLIVGQETLRWYKNYTDFFAHSPAESRIEKLMSGYDEFNFAQNEKERRNTNSPFWRTFRELGDAASGQVLWTNIFRCSVEGGSVPKNSKKYPNLLDAIYAQQQGLLSEEIRILAPTAVIFFTGPHYDGALKKEFDDVEFSQFEKFNERQFACVKSLKIGIDKCFRLYHPNYLSRKKLDWVSRIKENLH